MIKLIDPKNFNNPETLEEVESDIVLGDLLLHDFAVTSFVVFPGVVASLHFFLLRFVLSIGGNNR